MARQQFYNVNRGDWNEAFPKLRSLRELEVRVRPTGIKVPMGDGTAFNSPSVAANAFKAMSDRRPAESLMVAYLDGKNRPIGIFEAARGGNNVVHVSPREVLAPGLVIGASGMIIAHNHPSGDPSPSVDDTALTQRIRSGGELVGLPLVDHLVIGEEDAYSFTGGVRTSKLWKSGHDYAGTHWGELLAAAGTLAFIIGGAVFGARLLRKSADDKPGLVGLDVFCGSRP